jgi:hypothetical protein
LDELLSSGKINRDTLVWREGMTDWQPLTAVRPGGPPPIPGSKTMVCAECGRTFPPEDLIPLNRSWICARCKPVYLQRMIEGVRPAHAAHTIWRMNKQLVTRSETPFPDRCVKCNAPAGGFRLKRVLYWQPPAFYLLLFCNILVMLIVIMIVRKKAVLQVGVCEIHRVQRRQAIWTGWLGSFGGLALAMFGGAAFHSVWVVLLGVVVFFGAIIYGGLKGVLISAAKITTENVWVKGVHRDFLAELPEWPDP